MQRGRHDGRVGARAGEDGEEEPAAFELHEGGQHGGAGAVLYIVLRAGSLCMLKKHKLCIG